MVYKNYNLIILILFKYDLIIITIVSCIFLIYTIRFLINGRKNFNVFKKRR